MQGLFKWAVLIVICLSLSYLAFTNRYIIIESEASGQGSSAQAHVAQGPITIIVKYDRWTHKILVQKQEGLTNE